MCHIDLMQLTSSFQLVDVFGSGPYLGNPLAVLRLEADAATDELQALTRWMNLSETAFVLPPTVPGADYRVRIFTLDRELPFAGHPSLGSCHAWARWSGCGKDEIVQECGLGLVPIRRQTGGYAFRAPPLVRSGPVEPAVLARALDALALRPADVLASAWVDNGPGWIGLQLRDADAVLAVQPSARVDGRLDVGLVGAHPPGGDLQFELRAFFTDEAHRVIEDPVTGSLNASIGEWLFARGLARGAYRARQGTCIGRSGLVQVTQDGAGQVWVGGPVATYGEGTFPLRSCVGP